MRGWKIKSIIMVLETAALVSTSKLLVEKLIVELVTPKIKQLVNLCKNKYNESMLPTAEHFQEYLIRTYDKYSIINTLVLHNTQLRLKDIYVAQTLVKEDIYDGNKIFAKIDKLPIEIIKKYKKILITDTAGMGKSTITRRMFIDLIDNSIGEIGIPIYLELNKLNKNRTLITEIQEELNSLSRTFDSDLLLKLIQTGGFIFFFDGYDEISITDRGAVTQDIQSFISKAGTRNYYILTSRPEDGLTSFGDFQSFKINALKKEEAFDLLAKYDKTPKKELSQKLISLLKTGEYSSIDEYLKNPLLVSLLFAAFDHKQTIPLKKHLFYKQVYEAFFENHDLSKGIDAHQKRSGLDVDDFSRMLKFVGYACLMKTGVKFDKDAILKVINKAKIYCSNLNFKESDFLKDMQTSVPLFCKDGNEYKWVHKSLMEYFAARFIADESRGRQDTILTDILNSEYVEKYINLLDLYYDIDHLGFIKNIELPILEKYLSFHQSSYFESSTISSDLINERIGCLFEQRIFFEDINAREHNAQLLFKETHKKIEKEYGIKIDTLTLFSHGNMIIHSIQPCRIILSVISKRRKDLFMYTTHKKEDSSIKINNKMFEVKADTLSDDKKKYRQLNIMLINYRHNLCLDYEQCKKELEQIKIAIKNNDDCFTLLNDL